jgi:hypothetical protein
MTSWSPICGGAGHRLERFVSGGALQFVTLLHYPRLKVGLHPKDGTIAKVNSSTRNAGAMMAKGGETSDGTRTGS